MKSQNILLDREWNNAQIYNLSLLWIENKIHEARHIYKTTGNNTRQKNAYIDFKSHLEELVDFMVDSPRFDIDKLSELRKQLLDMDKQDFNRLCSIHLEVKLILRFANVMDYKGESLKPKEMFA